MITQAISRWLWIFAALFILPGLAYSALTPIFENSDETLHYPYIKHLADGRGLPLAIPGQLWQQEGTQPPLYYALAAAATFWIDTDNLADHLQRNPHWLFSEVRALINDNQNLVLHGPMDTFPYRRAALAIYVSRGWSLIFGLATVVAVFHLARHLFPDNLPLILTTTALTALNPQFIRVSATVSNDSLSAALTTLAVLLAFQFTQAANQPGRSFIKASPPHPPDMKLRALWTRSSLTPPLMLGLLCGLAVLTKLSSLSTFLLVALIVLWRLFFISELHEAPLFKAGQWLMIIGLAMALLTGWWFLRNYQRYGEWFAVETHLNLAGRAHLALAEAWDLRREAERAYWATFGWGQIRPPEWVFQLLFWFTRLGLIGLSLAVLTKLIWGKKPAPLPFNLSHIDFGKTIFLLFWAALNLALYLGWVMQVGSVSHTRLVFPAIAAISLLIALGWHALIPTRLAGGFSLGLIGLLAALNVYSLGWLIYPAFKAEGGAGAAENNPSTAAMLELTFLDRLKMNRAWVYAQDQTPDLPKSERQAGRGDIVMVEVEWETLAAPDKNYSVAALLVGPDGAVLARRETYPGLGLRPTRYLSPNDTFVDRYPLELEAEVSEPIIARAAVNLFDLDSDTRAGFPALDSARREVTPIVGQIKLVPQTWPQYRPRYPAYINFAHAIALLGYDLTPATTGEAAGPELTLYWESLAPVALDYVVFLHLLDARGKLITQVDAPPTQNAYPTSWWSPGEVIADRRLLPLGPEAATLRLGLYDLASGQRLAIIDTTLPHQEHGAELTLP